MGFKTRRAIAVDLIPPSEHMHQYIVSASKLRNLMMCERLPYMDAFGETTRRVDPPESRIVFMQGLTHEEEVAERRRWIPNRDPTESKEGTVPAPPHGVDPAAWTLAEMRKGTPEIAQGVLKSGHWWGAPDWLIRKEGHSDLGDWYYEPHDAKSGKKGYRKTLTVPLAFYALLLEKIQGVRPETFTIHTWDPPEISHRVDDYVSDLQHALSRIDRILGRRQDPGPFLTSACRRCRWHQVCVRDARRRNHLSLLHGMRRNTLARFEAAGISNLDDLAVTRPAEIQHLPYFHSEQSAQRIIAQAKSYLSELPKIVGEPNLPEAQEIELFIDFEGDGIDNKTDAFMFGLMMRVQDQVTYRAFLAEKSREQAWNSFIHYLKGCPKDSMIYHFGTYDREIVKGFGDAAEQEWLLPRLFDVSRVARDHVAVPAKQLGLKAIAQAFGFRWGHPEATGLMCQRWWRQWRREQDKGALDTLLRYNADDIRALILITDTLRDFANREIDPEILSQYVARAMGFAKVDLIENHTVGLKQ